MNDIRQYLDSTYLKTPEQAGLSADENRKVVAGFVLEAIAEKFKLIMIRPDMVAMARQMILQASSSVLVGTVISFPDGIGTLDEKLAEARQAIANGADDLDFVCNYRAFKNGDEDLVRREIEECTRLGLEHLKTVKWIIEIAALTPDEITRICSLIKNVVVTNFEGHYNEVFVKSSTGFYQTAPGVPNGATEPAIINMLENSAPLPVKAAGGVRSLDEAIRMINLGVKRIGTSSAKAIVDGHSSTNGY